MDALPGAYISGALAYSHARWFDAQVAMSGASMT